MSPLGLRNFASGVVNRKRISTHCNDENPTFIARRSIVAVVVLAASAISTTAHAVPSPDVVVGITQTLYVYLTVLVGGFATLFGVVRNFVLSRKNPIRLLGILLVLVFGLWGLTLAVTFWEVSEKNFIKRVIEESRIYNYDLTWHVVDPETRRAQEAYYQTTDSGTLQRRLLQNEKIDPFFVCFFPYFGTAIHYSGVPAFGPNKKTCEFVAINTWALENYLSSIPVEVRSARDLFFIVRIGPTVQILPSPGQDSGLLRLIESFRSVGVVKYPSSSTDENRQVMYIEDWERGALVPAELYPEERRSTKISPYDQRNYYDLRNAYPDFFRMLDFDQLEDHFTRRDSALVVATLSLRVALELTLYNVYAMMAGRLGDKFDKARYRAYWEHGYAEWVRADLEKIGVYVVDINSRTFQGDVDALARSLAGRPFVVSGLDYRDVAAGRSIVWELWRRFKSDPERFRFAGHSTQLPFWSARWAVEHNSKPHGAPALKWLRTKVAANLIAGGGPAKRGVGAALIILTLCVVLIYAPFAYINAAGQVVRSGVKRQIASLGVPDVAETRRWLEKRLGLRPLLDVVSSSVALLFLVMPYSVLVHEQSPIHGRSFAWISDLGRPDIGLNLVLTAIFAGNIYAALLFQPRALVEPWSAKRHSATGVGLLAGLFVLERYVPAGLGIYIAIVGVTRLLLNALAHRRMRNMVSSLDPIPARESANRGPEMAQVGFVPLHALSSDVVGKKAGNLAFLFRIPHHRLFQIPKAGVLWFEEGGFELAPAVSERLRSYFGTELPLAVRSTAMDEDGKVVSQAGRYVSKLHVEIDRVGTAGKEVVASYRRAGSDDRVVLVQQMAPGDISGVLFSRSPTNPGVMHIEFTSGYADRLVSGEASGAEFLLSRDHPDLAQYQRESRELLVHLMLAAFWIERAFQTSIDLEWNYDREKKILYVIQVRAITAFAIAPAVRDEQQRLLKNLRETKVSFKRPAFRIHPANEVLTDTSCFTLSLFERMYRRGGAVESAAQYLGLTPAVLFADGEALRVFGRLYQGPNASASALIGGLVRDTMLRRRGRRYIIRRGNDILTRLTNELPDATEPEITKCDGAGEFAAAIVCGVQKFQKAIAIEVAAGLAARRLMTADDIASVETRATRLVDALRQLASGGDEATFLREWGLRSANDYELSVPSFCERTADAHRMGKQLGPPRAEERQPPAMLLHRFMALREEGKHRAVTCLRSIRPHFLQIADVLGLDEDVVFGLSLGDIERLTRGELPSREVAQLAREGHEAHKELRRVFMPDELRGVDVTQLGRVERASGAGADRPNGGRMLSVPRAFGGVLRPPVELGIGPLTDDHVVLYTQFLHPEIVQHYDKIRGVVTQTGSELSHAAIVARESNIPVLRMMNGWAAMQPGDHVEVSESGGVLLRSYDKVAH